MANEKRNLPGNKIQDPSSIANNTYNEKAGAQKNTEVGRKLVPIQTGASTYTTDCSTAKALPSPGRNLAVYNNNTALGSITTGPAGVTSLAAGVTDANGRVGIPCAPGEWTYIACGLDTFVIASAATLLVFLIDDEGIMTPESTR